jgi:hypothetical protein
VADAGAREVEQRAARSERARRGNRRVRALAMGERRSWAEQALEQARRRCRRRRCVSAGAGPERRRTARNEQWCAGRIQTCESQRDVGHGHARFGRARMEVRCGGSGPTRTKGNEAAHDDNLARTAAEGPAMRQGRGECGSGNRRKKSNHAGQRRARRQRLAHRGVSAGRAQAATELVYRKVARSAGGAVA